LTSRALPQRRSRRNFGTTRNNTHASPAFLLVAGCLAATNRPARWQDLDRLALREQLSACPRTPSPLATSAVTGLGKSRPERTRQAGVDQFHAARSTWAGGATDAHSMVRVAPWPRQPRSHVALEVHPPSRGATCVRKLDWPARWHACWAPLLSGRSPRPISCGATWRRVTTCCGEAVTIWTPSRWHASQARIGRWSDR
jgi:hypothetical protein